jgi:hypothetical protein
MSEHDDYFDFLDESLASEEDIEIKSSELNVVRPKWVSEGNISLKAYQAIEAIKKEKHLSISQAGDKRDLTKKSSYHISKVEVAKLVGVKPQPLFHSATTTYSKGLLDHYNSVNDELIIKKEAKLKRSKNGIGNQTKEELVIGFKKQKTKLLQIEEKISDELYAKFKSQLSLDVKSKLKVK